MPINMNNNMDLRGNLLTIDENGDIWKCFTDIYDNFVYEKKEVVDGINVYFEKGTKRKAQAVKVLKALPKEYKIATRNIFYFTPKTWSNHKMAGAAWTFARIASIRESEGFENDGEYHLYSMYHEMGHNLDGAYWYIKGKELAEEKETIDLFSKYVKNYKINTNNTYLTNPQNQNSRKSCPNKFYKRSDFKNDSDGSKYNEWFYSCVSFKYLRNYSFSDASAPYSELWADIVLYSYTTENNIKTEQRLPVTDEINKFRKKYIDYLWKNKDKILQYRNSLKVEDYKK